MKQFLSAAVMGVFLVGPQGALAGPIENAMCAVRSLSGHMGAVPLVSTASRKALSRALNSAAPRAFFFQTLYEAQRVRMSKTVRDNGFLGALPRFRGTG